MIKRLTKLRATLFALLLSGVIWLLAYAADIDIFEELVAFLTRLEKYEADEIFVTLILLLMGIAVDTFVMKREERRKLDIFNERLRVLHATMRTVQDIVGNFLNQLQLFRRQAAKCKAFPPESGEAIDALVKETASKLKALGDLEDTPEKELYEGMTVIDLSASPTMRPDGR